VARRPEDDPDEALDRALEGFWERGYTDTSIQDLVDGTGVQRYGLYESFGNKHGLFLAALDRYQARMVDGFLARLEREDADLQDLENFLAALASQAGTPRRGWGCLMCNTAAELGTTDPEAAARVDHYVSRMERVFGGLLTRAQRRGEVREDAEPSEAARYMVGVVMGACVFAKTPDGPERVRDMVKHATWALAA
jgi:TetR/AcrR family transcriptional repressor of nem operon